MSGIKWTSISSIFIAFIQLAQLAILAHYLEPSDFGLIAIVSVIIGFSALFMDLGISSSIIHSQDITHEQLSSLYWLNIASGIFLFVIIYCLAPVLAVFYNENELIPIIQLLAVTFIISGVGNQYSVLLQKELQFNVMAKISIISMLLGFIVSVGLAIRGHGVYALVYSSLVNSTAGSVFNILIGIKSYRPSLIYRHQEIMPMITFGMFQMGEKSLNFINSQFDVILIGKLLGTEALGIYTVSKNLSTRPAQVINPIITKVTFPIMAKVQDDVVKLRAIYLKTINYLSSVNFPVYILLAILAKPIILILFGEKWQDSIIILQILSVYGAIRSTGNPVGSLLLAKGRADMGFYWNLGLFTFIPLTIYIGSQWKLGGVAYSLLGLMTFLTIPNWYFMVKPLCEAGFTEYFQEILKPLFIATAGGIISYGTSQVLNLESMSLFAITITITMGVVVLLSNIYLNRKFIDTVLELLGKKNGKPL